jgi:hypothetical protein
MQKIYDVGPCLLDACNATDLSDLFKAGSIPLDIATPEPSTASVLIIGIVLLTSGSLLRRYTRR